MKRGMAYLLSMSYAHAQCVDAHMRMRQKMASLFFDRASSCVVTGASRGIGRELAVQLAQKWKEKVSCFFFC